MLRGYMCKGSGFIGLNLFLPGSSDSSLQAEELYLHIIKKNSFFAAVMNLKTNKKINTMKKTWLMLVIAAMFSFAACQSNTQKPQQSEPVEEQVIEEQTEGDTLAIQEEAIEGEETPAE